LRAFRIDVAALHHDGDFDATAGGIEQLRSALGADLRETTD
jgi:hypothetical protein